MFVSPFPRGLATIPGQKPTIIHSYINGCSNTVLGTQARWNKLTLTSTNGARRAHTVELMLVNTSFCFRYSRPIRWHTSFCSGIVDDAFSQRVRKMIWLDVSTGLCLQKLRAYEDIAILVADFIVIAQWNMLPDQTRGVLRKDFGITSDTLP